MRKGHLNSWVVSHSALIIGTLRHALGHEFEPWWQQTLYGTQAQHQYFIHDSIWFIWFDIIICLSNLSPELWNRKFKIKENYLRKNIGSCTSTIQVLKMKLYQPSKCIKFWFEWRVKFQWGDWNKILNFNAENLQFGQIFTKTFSPEFFVPSFSRKTIAMVCC